MSKQKTNRGFTIVELLIVIVVIAILAAISIIAFNGIQDRARDTTAQETAAQLRAKVESYNAVKGEYPAPAATTIESLLGVLDDEKESTVDAALESKMVASGAAVTPDKPVKYTPCAIAANGGSVWYWQKTAPTTHEYKLGNCTP